LEFGLYNNEIILIDEIFTPDSSRFWDNEGFEPGKSQTSFDKQFVRDYLISKGIQHKENIAEDDEILRLPEYIIQKHAKNIHRHTQRSQENYLYDNSTYC